jgi:DNA-binding transcriptional ArsR family regulator
MENQFKQIASLIGDPTRATILWTLMDGKAFTATELSIAADTSPQNISMHLHKMVEANLLCVENQGRHKYYKYARKEIAYVVEALANLTSRDFIQSKNGDVDISPIKYCRTCYDHLAGKVGVMLTDSLLKQKIIAEKENEYEVSAKGKKFFSAFDIQIEDLQQQRRAFARPCLDWSERRHHMAGSLATALLDKMFSSDWIRKVKSSRAVIITAKGEKEMSKYFKVELPYSETHP